MTRWNPVVWLICNRLPSRTRSDSTGTRVFWFRFWILPEPLVPVPLDKGNGGSGNEIGSMGLLNGTKSAMLEGKLIIIPPLGH